jgi:hypothetical protein
LLSRCCHVVCALQCCGSMTFWCGSGSADPCLWLLDPDPDPDPDPSIFIIYLQNANKKRIKKKSSCILLFEGTFTSFFKDKKSKRSHNTVEIKGFLTYLLNDKRIRIRIRNTAALCCLAPGWLPWRAREHGAAPGGHAGQDGVRPAAPRPRRPRQAQEQGGLVAPRRGYQVSSLSGTLLW